jgi:hypothetical protein
LSLLPVDIVASQASFAQSIAEDRIGYYRWLELSSVVVGGESEAVSEITKNMCAVVLACCTEAGKK